MTARFIMIASLALLAACAGGGNPAGEKPSGQEQGSSRCAPK